MNPDTHKNTSTVGIITAALAGAGAIALAAATASDGTIFILPNWLLVMCIVAVVAASLYLAEALRVTRLAMLLTGLGALGMAISAGSLCKQSCSASKCSRWAEPTVKVPVEVSERVDQVIAESVLLDWADNAERAANLTAHPDSVADARRDAQRDIREGHLMLHVPDYYEVWQASLVEELTSQGVRMDYTSSCGMRSDSILAYMRAYNDAVREALDGFHHQSGYVSRLSRVMHMAYGNDSGYHPYVL